MPRCRIDIEASPTFQRLLREYQRRYPRTRADLVDAFSRIEQDPEHAAHATPLIGFGRRVWKYRSKHSDLSRGARGGYRIIAVYDGGNAILWPILLYAKVDRDDVPADVVKRAVEEIREALRAASSHDAQNGG